MADWVHCNNCFVRPGGGKIFSLTNCGHMYCADCLKGEYKVVVEVDKKKAKLLKANALV